MRRRALLRLSSLRWTGPLLRRFFAPHAAGQQLLASAVEGVFTGGPSLESALRTKRLLAERGLSVALDHCREDVGDAEAWARALAAKEDLVRAAGDHGVPFVALKVSGFGRVWPDPTAAAPPPPPPEDEYAHSDQLSDADRRSTEERLASLAYLAAQRGVRLLVDAERSAQQPHVRAAVLRLCEERRLRSIRAPQRVGPVLFNTYQMYLRGAEATLRADLARAQAGGFPLGLGVKLVRGAYLSEEPPSAVLASKAATDAAFDAAVRASVAAVAGGAPVKVVVATHNSRSVRAAVLALDAAGLRRSDPRVWFAHILGVADDGDVDLLLAADCNVLALVLFGAPGELSPWLLRRLAELRKGESFLT